MRRTRLASLLLLTLAAACGAGGSSVVGGVSIECPSASATASPSQTSAGLSWDAGNDSRIAGYRVYYGTASRDYAQAKGAGLDAGNCTRYIVDNLGRGRTYYFAVTAYDASGNESDFSNEASKSIP